MTNKELRVRRVRGYFIDAAKEIVAEEGIDAVTIRKVAQRAGYNSATLYNYFKNINHLIAITLHDLMGTYVETILDTLSGKESPYELYRTNWFVYVEMSFRLPKEYYYLFFKYPELDISEVYDEYFGDHPGRFEKLPVPFQNMCRAQNQYSRDLAFLKTDFGHVDDTVLKKISEMNILLYKAMLSDLAKEEKNENFEEQCQEYIDRFRSSQSPPSWVAPVRSSLAATSAAVSSARLAMSC